MRIAFAALVLLSILFSSSHALYPVGSRAVIIRIDDVQDYAQPSPYALPEKTTLQYHIDQRMPALVSVIASRFGNDPQLVDQIKEGLNMGVFTVALHGWHHSYFDNLSLTEQTADLQRGKNRLEAVLGIQVLSFVPPYAKFNDQTISAMKESGFTLFSSATYEGDVPREENGLTFIPQSVTTAEVEFNTDNWRQLPIESIAKQINESWDSYGVAVVVVHPRQFIGPDGETMLKAYAQLLDWIQNEGGKIVHVQPKSVAKKYIFDPFMISVGIFGGLTSTLLIAFNLSARRSRRHQENVKRSRANKGLSSYRVVVAE